MITKFSIRLIKKIIPALVKSIAKMKMGKMGKAGLIAGGIMAVGTAGYMMTRGGGKDEETGDGEWTTLPSVTPRSFEDAYSKEDQAKINEMMKAKNFNKGGQVPGSGNTDTVPAMLTPGEFVMSKGAVQQYGVKTLEGMNAAAGGTNRPTLKRRFNEGGVVTDPKEKKAQEDYMLYWVNKERVEVLGLPPLKKLTYADGVELTKKMGPGPKVTETSDTNLDFDNMMKTTSRSKTVGDKSIFAGSVGLLTDEDKQQYLASNPGARMMMEMRDQLGLDALGANISASAKMNGGGLVQGFNGGGLVTVKPGSINSYQDAIDAGIKVEDIVTGTSRFGSIRWKEPLPRGLFGFGKKRYQIKGTKWMFSGTGGDVAEKLAIPTEDYVNMKMGWSKSSKASSKTSAVKKSGGGSGILGPISSAFGKMVNKDKYKVPPPGKKSVVQAYEEEKSKIVALGGGGGNTASKSKGGNDLPNINAAAKRSVYKIKTLGISV